MHGGGKEDQTWACNGLAILLVVVVVMMMMMMMEGT
jgi:hypothetical protein